MLCSICNKNIATVHVQEIVGGRKRSIHLCQDCATAKGLNVLGPEGFNLAEFLYKISSSNIEQTEDHVIKENEANGLIVTSCKECGWDSEKIRKTGRLGCPKCYHAFKDELSRILSVTHRGSVHCGKIPLSSDGERSLFIATLLTLERKLETYIKSEEYEEAARVRDKLRELRAAEKREKQ